jgi:hypothetical protein
METGAISTASPARRPADPEIVDEIGRAGELLHSRRFSEAIARGYLDRIARLDGVLGSYQHVAA